MAHSELALILLLGTLSVTVATFLGERTKLWFMTDSGIAIIVGLVLGGIHYIYTLADDVEDDTQQLKLFEFQPGIFTLLLLPPIIFESGYNLNHRSFFANIGPIIIFAFLGTLVYDPYGGGFNRYANFETFTRSFHSLWRMATGDAWSAQFADAYFNPHVPGVNAPPSTGVAGELLSSTSAEGTQPGASSAGSVAV